MSLADEIKRLRQSAGLSQDSLAAQIGSTQGFVSHLENGRTTNFSVEMMFKLCDAFGVAADHFRPFLTSDGGEAPEGEDERAQGKRK